MMEQDKYLAWADIKGIKYPLCLTIGAADSIEKELGSLDAPLNMINQSIKDGKMADMLKAVLKTAQPLAKAGRDYIAACALMSGDKDQVEEAKKTPVLPSNDVLENVLSAVEIMKLWNACYLATQGGASREVEVEPDNSAKNAGSAM